MMAARAGADNVVGVEMGDAMCSIADSVIAANGFSAKCTILQADARRLYAQDSPGLREGRKPNGSLPELESRCDVLVFEVFDCGLIGEGALHLSAIAAHRLLLPHAAIIPARARVFCQPIQMRVTRACGVDVEGLNRYNWRPDYEGHDLGRIREQWSPMAAARRVCEFTFADYAASATPASITVPTVALADGVVNAVALWFELDLDDTDTLSTDPNQQLGAGPTWQQAVHFIKEIVVATGEVLVIEASHDTYSFSARVCAAANVACTCGTNAVRADVRLQVQVASRKAGSRSATKRGLRVTRSWRQ